MFTFIWKHSKRDQLILLAFTSVLFPFLFLTLELPKRIINDAIGAQSATVFVFGYELSQVTFLALLCVAFLASVLAHGLLKMRINTMKGVLSERLLRRLRYGLIARMLRFPSSYFQRTSQGEIVSMVTGETEPMGGMMGDALTQPVLQAGQMLTILTFLFLQSVWFGLAACALIPLQAWLIPKLQRQINLMNKERIKEVRKLAGMIGESAVGSSTLRSHGGWRYRLAQVTERLGVLYAIRFQIYRKKFFMKFINNFITQLTPFFFFSVGGYLVIQGAVSLGALVAALAAYKDLSSPWKELLAYYNQAQDMSLRWEIVQDRFSPTGMVDETLFEGTPDVIEHLKGPITLQSVTVVDADGNAVLDDVSLSFPAAAQVAIAARSEEDRQALAALLRREVMPVSGKVLVGDRDLAHIHQAVIAARIGHADSQPVLFQGSFGENVMMPLRFKPIGLAEDDNVTDVREAERSGNSADTLNAPWLDPKLAELNDSADLQSWWLSLVEAMGTGGPLFRRALDQPFRADAHSELAERIIALRPKVEAALDAAGLSRHIYRFDPALYNPALPVASNLFFATLRNPMAQQELAQQTALFEVLSDLGLANGLLELSVDVIEMLSQIFGSDEAEHPLFRKLGLEPSVFATCVGLVRDLRQSPGAVMSPTDKAMLMTLPAQVSAEQIGPAFTTEMKERILTLRAQNSDALQNKLGQMFAPLDDQAIAPGLTVLENAIFGKISDGAGARADEIRTIVSEVLLQEGVRPLVIQLIYDLEMTLGGSNLPRIFAEPLAVGRATIKRPDILLMEQTLASFDAKTRQSLYRNLRALMPDATMIYLQEEFEDPDDFDVYIEVSEGRIVNAEGQGSGVDDTLASSDLNRKVRALESTALFSGLNRRQLRLLAFGARWFEASEGEVIFQKDDDPTDGAYMLLAGTAGLYEPQPDGMDNLITTVGQGTLVGELGLIRNVPRALTMRAHTDVEALRLGAEEFLAVVENDASTAFKLLQVVAGYAGR